MSKLQLYVLKEVLNAFVPAFLALLFIMVLGFCVQLIYEGLDVVRLRGLPYHIASFSVPWVLPSALLTAVIMAFGRLSADNEIVAMQSGGVSLFHVVFPVYILALLLSGVAAYFHFHTLPRAGEKIQLLKFEAVKQILLDRVALSAKRQFSFRPCTIYYDDFRDGRMIDLLILECQQGVPRTIIIAEEGTMQPDLERPEFVSLVLQDCAVTQLGEEELGGPGTWKAQQIVLPVKVAADPTDILTEVKHLTLGDMLRRGRELEQKVSDYPRLFVNPNNAVHEARRQIEKVNIQRAELKDILRRNAEKLKRLTEEERRVLERTIEQKQEQRRNAEETRNVLSAELVSYMTELEELQKQAEPERAYDRIANLQKKVRETKAKVDALAAEIAQAEAAVDKANGQLRRNAESAQEIASEAKELQAELAALEEQWQKWRKIVDMAEAQDELRELKIRYHQRLALAMAVFAFATVGVPLGIMMRRRSSMAAFGIGFGIMLLLFYPLLIVGQIAAEAGLLSVEPAMWSGNGVTFLVGLVLTAVVLRR